MRTILVSCGLLSKDKAGLRRLHRIASELRGLLIDRKLGSEALAWLGLPVGVQEAADLHVCTGLSHAVVASRIVISGCIDVLINSSRRERIRSPILGTVAVVRHLRAQEEKTEAGPVASVPVGPLHTSVPPECDSNTRGCGHKGSCAELVDGHLVRRTPDLIVVAVNWTSMTPDL